MQFTYILLTALVFVFHILYKGDLSFILLVFLLIMPLLLFIILMIQSAMLKIYVEHTSDTAERGKPETIRIHLENRCFLPVTSCKVTLRYKCCFPPDKPLSEKYSLTVPVAPLSSKEILNINFTPQHCGYMDISSKSAVISDLIGLTFIRKKLRYGNKIIVLPNISPFGKDMEKSFAYDTESDTFSDIRPGDDPSEIFELREYRGGDRMNRIHWKLSSRGEDLIVKELSEPISSKILILCDKGSCRNSEETDKILDIAATLSNFMIHTQTVHSIAAVSESGALMTAEISDSTAFMSAFSSLCGGASYTGMSITDETLRQQLSELIQKGFSHILAISPTDDKAFLEELESICAENKLTVFCTSDKLSDPEKQKEFFSADIIYSAAEELDDKCREHYSGEN